VEYKTVVPEVKDIEGRTVTAVIATLDRPDAQKDTVRDGFFPVRPMPALVVPAHRWEQVPLGKSWSYQRGSEVYSRILFNHSREAESWLEAIRFDYAHGEPLQRWSWGFRAYDDAQTRTKGGRDLHARRDGSAGVMLHEVPPVLLAASVGTRTVSVKSGDWRGAMLARIGR
jgi:hypothetical protein